MPLSQFAPTEVLEMLALRALVERAPTGMCLFDYDLRYLYINDALAEINGIPVSAHIGRTVPELLPEFYARMQHFIAPVLRDGTPLIDILFEGETPKQPGVVRSWVQSWTPIQVPGWMPAIAVICREVTEERRLAVSLAKANRQKDALLATVAHELRNPLAPLSNAVHMLQFIGTEDVLRVYDIMHRQIGQLSRLVDDLMDASRLNHGTLTLKPALLDVRDVVSDAARNVQPAIDCKRQALLIQVPRQTLTVHGDALRLTQLVSNLLQNASKFTGVGGTVSVTALDNEQDIIIRVADTGVGIPSDKLAHIFTLFAQLSSEEDSAGAHGGMGIGLALAKAIANSHGGSITAASQGARCGSVFEVRLPRAPAEDVSQP